MGFTDGNNDSAVTPYRLTHVRFDIPENTLREPAFDWGRSAHQIAQGHDGQANSQNWHYLESGAIAVRPWQDDPSNLHQKIDTPGAIIPLADFQTIDGVKSRNTWRAPTDLMGVTVDPSVAATGDPWLNKTTAAGTTWAKTLQPDIDAFGAIGSNNNVNFDRVAVGNKEQGDNQGYVVRMVVPAASPHYKDSVGAFYFGGPISQNTSFTPSGVYCLEFLGTGYARLLMRKGDGNGGYQFVEIDYWEAFNRSSTTQVIICRIWPHYASDGTPVIHFATDTSGSAGPQGSLTQSYFNPTINPKVHIWYGWKVNGLPVTGTGPVRVDQPRDQRPPFQVSILKFPNPAFVFDDFFALDFLPTTVAPMSLFWDFYAPSDTTVLGGLYDGTTGIALSPIDSGNNFQTYTLNPGQPFYNARFTLTPSSDQNLSPLLFGYRVIRDAVYSPLVPGEQSLPDTYPPPGTNLRSVNISGPDKDFTHETASIVIEDPGANLAILNTRARVRTRIETEYDPDDSSLRSVLFDGFADRSDGKLKGTQSNYGLSQSGAVRQFPSQDWKEFNVTFSGIWRRLHEKLTMKRVFLAPDSVLDANGLPQPFKVTDVCRKMLGWIGFSPAEIDIPDSPLRFFPSGGGADESVLEPLAPVGDTVAGFLHDYLGWFLVWDGNAGDHGMIRAVVPPPLEGPYFPLANFTLGLPSQQGRLTHKPATYGSYGWVATGTSPDIAIPTAFIRKRTFQTHVKPPEANAIMVTSTGGPLPNNTGQYNLNQWVWNPASYDFFVDEFNNIIHTADPTNPDYLGEFIPLVVVNTSLGAGENGQHSVDILTRRYYDTVAHAQKWAMFEAPLVLVIDGNDGFQAAPRPLRYYDAITITDGGQEFVALVRSCNPFYHKDSLQLAHYEIQFITL